MKKFYVALLCLCTIFTLRSSGQRPPPLREPDKNRPLLFRHLPDTLVFEAESFRHLFDRPVGQFVHIQVPGALPFVFEGQVVSKANKYENRIKSVVIRSGNARGASLVFSETLLEDGTTSFRGFIMHRESGDLFVLENYKEQWLWIKKGFYEVINE